MISSSAFQNTVQPTNPYTNSNRAGGNSPENELKCCTYYGEVWRTCMFGNKILLTRRVVQANSTRSDHFLIADCQTDGSRFVARRERQHGIFFFIPQQNGNGRALDMFSLTVSTTKRSVFLFFLTLCSCFCSLCCFLFCRHGNYNSTQLYHCVLHNAEDGFVHWKMVGNKNKILVT